MVHGPHLFNGQVADIILLGTFSFIRDSCRAYWIGLVVLLKHGSVYWVNLGLARKEF
jgi:hypothetical protein